MVTRSDLVEAQSFGRRRLVAAFLSGAPGGHADAPPRPGRTVVGGLALAVLLAAGAVIANALAPRPPGDWTSHGLIVSEETGQPYVILPDDGRSAPVQDGRAELRPVANLTSAALILGPGVEPLVIAQDVIEGQQVGADIGILGAPASLPPPDLLIESGWTACAADSRGIRVSVATEPDVDPAPDAGQVVVVGDDSYLIASERVGDEPPAAFTFRLPRGDAVDNLLGSMGLPARALAPRVPRAWLDLFPRGAALEAESLRLTRVGRRPGAWDGAGVPARARVGDVLVDGQGDAVLMTAGGPADLDPFALAVHTHGTLPGLGEPQVIPVPRMPELTRTTVPAADTHWPTALPGPTVTDPCAVLVTAPGRSAVVQLAQGPGDGHSADDVRPGQVDVAVDPGRGAYVLVAGAAGRDPLPVVVDGTGRTDPLDGADIAAQLGYADVPAPVVPAAWVRLFPPGVALSRELALCGPGGMPSCGDA